VECLQVRTMVKVGLCLDSRNSLVSSVIERAMQSCRVVPSANAVRSKNVSVALATSTRYEKKSEEGSESQHTKPRPPQTQKFLSTTDIARQAAFAFCSAAAFCLPSVALVEIQCRSGEAVIRGTIISCPSRWSVALTDTFRPIDLEVRCYETGPLARFLSGSPVSSN
jgi:hypothetical protein